jgi:hypothetical protein
MHELERQIDGMTGFAFGAPGEAVVARIGHAWPGSRGAT